MGGVMVWNQIKTALLLGALSGFFLFIGAYLGGQAGLVVAFSLALLMNFVSYFWSDKIVLFAYRAKEANPGDYPRLHQLVEEIAKKAKMEDIYNIAEKISVLKDEIIPCGNYKAKISLSIFTFSIAISQFLFS